MQFTIFTLASRWTWLLSETDAKGKTRVLTKALAKHDTQEACEEEVARVKAGISENTSVVVLGMTHQQGK